MSTEKYRARINQVISEIAHDRITLPTLPDIAIKFQILVDDPDVTNERLAAILLSDQFILSQIMRAANSAALAGMPQVDNVKAALLRLGQRQVRNLVMSITMNKMFYSAQPAINLRMKQVLARSRRVAAISYVVAAEQPHLSADQAMLAGLMHNIGVLPLCLYIEGQRAQTDDDEIGQLIDHCHSAIGTRLLLKWNFPQEVIEAVATYENQDHTSACAGKADYADIILFATLLAAGHANVPDWEANPGMRRLGLGAQACAAFLQSHGAAIDSAESFLGGRGYAAAAGSALPSGKASVAQVRNKPRLGLHGLFARLWRGG